MEPQAQGKTRIISTNANDIPVFDHPTLRIQQPCVLKSFLLTSFNTTVEVLGAAGFAYYFLSISGKMVSPEQVLATGAFVQSAIIHAMRLRDMPGDPVRVNIPLVVGDTILMQTIRTSGLVNIGWNIMYEVEI